MSYEKPDGFWRMHKDRKIEWYDKALSLALNEIECLRCELQTPDNRSLERDLCAAFGFTQTESEMFCLIYNAKGRPVRRESLLYQVRSKHKAREDLEIKIVDVMVCKIRKKLPPHCIETMWGIGYSITPKGLLVVQETIKLKFGEAAE